MSTTTATSYLPAGPLLTHVELAGGPAAVGWPKGSTGRRAIDRARREGVVSIRKGDEMAVALGLHPMEIWGNEWLTA